MGWFAEKKLFRAQEMLLCRCGGTAFFQRPLVHVFRDAHSRDVVLASFTYTALDEAWNGTAKQFECVGCGAQYTREELRTLGGAADADV